MNEVFWLGWQDSNLRNATVKVWCLTGLATSQYAGVDDGTRTHDNQNHNLALYQLNYVHHVIMRQRRIELLTHSLEGCCSIQLSYWRKNVRDGGIRTPDLLVPSQTP